MLEIFKQFFLLGWVSFGGPAAHLGYFRTNFVEKLNWLSNKEYAQLVALSQFLPGPGSSQVGFAIGYQRAGLPGALAAFIGFTLPSVLLMILLAVFSSQLIGNSIFENVIHGLKLLAVVIVADAALGMYRNFCTSKLSSLICLVTAIVLLLTPTVWSQLLTLILAALIGQHWLKPDQSNRNNLHKPNLPPLALFLLFLFGLPAVASILPQLEIFTDFYQAGSLVFGGGHVVLPLLQTLLEEKLSTDTILTGYAAAQAVPGPMFTFATYLGYSLLPSAPLLGAIIATLAVFLPGFLLIMALLNSWQSLAHHNKVAGAINGLNAAVVGLLIAAFYQPVFSSAVTSHYDFAWVLAGVILLKTLKLPVLALVLVFVSGYPLVNLM